MRPDRKISEARSNEEKEFSISSSYKAVWIFKDWPLLPPSFILSLLNENFWKFFVARKADFPHFSSIFWYSQRDHGSGLDWSLCMGLTWKLTLIQESEKAYIFNSPILPTWKKLEVLNIQSCWKNSDSLPTITSSVRSLHRIFDDTPKIHTESLTLPVIEILQWFCYAHNHLKWLLKCWIFIFRKWNPGHYKYVC